MKKVCPTSLLVSVLALDSEDPTEENFFGRLQQAIEQGSQWVVVPFGFPSILPAKTISRDTYFSRIAKKYRIHLVTGFSEKRKRIARIYTPSGKVAGGYEQTHSLPDENFIHGNSLHPISTKDGLVGLSIGSDLYFPELQWSLVQQGADFLIHLDIDRGVNDHFYSVISPKVRAFDVHRPFILARPTTKLIKIAQNEEMEIPGTPMSSSVIYDQNGAILASTGFAQGIATAILRFEQHCEIDNKGANLPVARGLDAWKLYFNDSREKYFQPLRESYQPSPRPRYKKRVIRVAVLSHFYEDQLGKSDDKILLTLMEKACASGPDIIVTTEMENPYSRPEIPSVAKTLEKMLAMSHAANSYLLIGGMRPFKPKKLQNRSSYGWLWNRKGKRVFESAIMLYGKGEGQSCYDTDFGRIGIRLCGDVYAPELDRLFALQGADMVLNPSMSWAASGSINAELAQARAMDNGFYIVNAHLAFSDAGQRSQIMDPTGNIVASSAYYQRSVMVADIDLDSPRGVFVKGRIRKVNAGAYLAQYRSRQTYRLLPTEELLKRRRPELYAMLNTDRSDSPFMTRDRGDGSVLPIPVPAKD